MVLSSSMIYAKLC